MENRMNKHRFSWGRRARVIEAPGRWMDGEASTLLRYRRSLRKNLRLIFQGRRLRKKILTNMHIYLRRYYYIYFVWMKCCTIVRALGQVSLCCRRCCVTCRGTESIHFNCYLFSYLPDKVVSIKLVASK